LIADPGSGAIDAIASRTWDVIVVGTGMGGATLGHAMARAGKSVLFCEQGASTLDATGLRGGYAEAPDGHGHASAMVPYIERLRAAGRAVVPLEDVSGGRPRRMIPFVGAGTGGSSSLYGAALERLSPADFRPRRQHPEAPDCTLPEAWPISYDELAPYYTQAEELYRVRGSGDPLRTGQSYGYVAPPPPLSASARELADLLESKSLHPYHLPVACEYVPRCPGCQGYLCARRCKNDSAMICLTPAIRDHGAVLLDGCEVLRLEASGHRVLGVWARHQGAQVRLAGTTIVVAAGALSTPLLLLRSRSGDWPHGVANRSGLVGRNLMRHFVDLYAVSTKSSADPDVNLKELGLNDFYEGSRKLGTVQSFGAMPPSQVMAETMRRDLRTRNAHLSANIVGIAKPLIASLLDRMLGGKTILASIAEDLPYGANRVFAGVDRHGHRSGAIQYRISDYDRDRISTFRRHMRDVLAPLRYRLIKQAENNERLAHACGTCRFGDDERASVLDRYNRAHGIDNLYVVDASFFPSSGGTNPALTVAANALRVAKHLS
jgi:choline dehydrogenase-like flavoprotein